MSDRLPQLKLDAKNGGWPWRIDHPNDERALLDGCYPDFDACERVRRYYKTLLRVPDPSGGNAPFHLLDWWYRDVIGPLFGWKKKDGRRRFQKGFVTTAKKSGKSTVLAGLSTYMLCGDNEEESEVYSTAVDRDQAKIIFTKAMRSISLSPHLSRILRVVQSRNTIHHDKSGSRYESISSDADSTEGKNPHLVIADELHVWKDRQFFNSLIYGDIVRSQPMFLMITTAGENELSVGYEEYEAAKALLDPNDPYYVESSFAYVAEAVDVEAWDNPQSWLEASPSLRGEVDTERPRDKDDLPAKPQTLGTPDKLRDKMIEAKQTPARKREFIRYICNRWVFDAQDPYIESDDWDRCVGPVVIRPGESIHAALDLAQVDDMVALCSAAWDGDVLQLSWKFWTPEETVKRHEELWRVPLRRWVDDGHVATTPGRTIQYQFIRREISGAIFDEAGQRLPSDPLALSQLYDLQELAIDPWNARELATNLAQQDSIRVVEFTQSMAMMNGPTKALLQMVKDGRIRHNGNPVAKWMIKNTACPPDSNENRKPVKRKSSGKIDGVVAAIMATGRATTTTPSGAGWFVT
jgi:phage terminase large subunit-like protein